MEVSRALPATVSHPRRYMPIAPDEIPAFPKQKMESAPSVTPGHSGTIVWFTEGEVRGFLVEIAFTQGPASWYLLPCTFLPQFGIDAFDGMLIQDVEAFELIQRLAWHSSRLAVFAGRDEIPTAEYLAARKPAPTISPADQANAQRALQQAAGILEPLLPQAALPAPALSAGEKRTVKRALALLESVLTLAPVLAPALWLTGKAQLLLGEPVAAFSFLLKAAAADPSQQQFAVDAGMAAVRLGKREDAARLSAQALATAPCDPELMSNHALALILNGHSSEAVSLCNRALAMPHAGKSVTQRVLAVGRAVASGKFPSPKTEADFIKIAKAVAR